MINKNIKRAYSEPSIEQVALDCDISLTLDSMTPWNDPLMNASLDPGLNSLDQSESMMPL